MVIFLTIQSVCYKYDADHELKSGTKLMYISMNSLITNSHNLLIKNIWA